MSNELQNWARNLTYGASKIHRPTTVEEVQELVRKSSKVRALGTRHSFNDIADTDAELIAMEGVEVAPTIDRERKTVTVGGGTKYGVLCQFLDREGFALHNLASLPHISVAGACATATHGSGVKNGNLATTVSAMKFVSADGSLVSLSRDQTPDELNGAVVGLGGIGIVTEMTLDVEPAYTMTQEVYDNLPFAALERHFEDVMSCAYSVSLFTFWTSDVINQVWVKRRALDDSNKTNPTHFGATAAAVKRTPVPEGEADFCTDQLGVEGPWYERLPHFRMGFTPSCGEELQSEYFVRREHAWNALQALNSLRHEVAPILHTTEVRTIARDNLWMSPCNGRDCVAIHFTWKNDWVKVRRVLPIIEEHLNPFDALPHWGKLFTFAPALIHSRYPKAEAFRSLLRSYDPTAKFKNRFLARYVFGE